jgi:predicted TIM-barrel fold metal-dependent hydrolase
VVEIWDVHCHLAGVEGETPERRIVRLLEYADRMGVARLCLSMGMSFSQDPAPDELRRQNDAVLAAIDAASPRVLGLVYVNPKHEAASLQEIDRCVGAGPMVGVKLWVAVRANDPRLDPIVERATELKAPLLQHTWIKATGNLPGESTPMDLGVLAARHPRATFVCGHSGGDWELGIRAVRPWANASVELGGGDPVAGITEMAVRELGAERVLFGSDVGGRSFASQLAKVQGAKLPEADKQAILGGNLQRMLGPILAAKGTGR